MSDDGFLLFMGCTVSITQTETAKLLEKILDKISVDYKIIDEPCCGGELFRLGFSNEAREQVIKVHDIFKQNNVKKIVTYCPECYVTLKDEYPKIIENYDLEVLHFTELIASYLDQGKIKFIKEAPFDKKVSFFDSCHVGREGKLYDINRKIINLIPRIQFKEMNLSREFALCCGGPIRVSFVELRNKLVERNLTDAKKKAKAKSGLIMACPTCYYNFDTYAKLFESKIKPISIVKLIAYSMGLIDKWNEETEN
ncbi:MAG: (Fe-S)-binding protein [Candidatus Helarchaeota archaeon]